MFFGINHVLKQHIGISLNFSQNVEYTLLLYWNENNIDLTVGEQKEKEKC